MDIRRNEDIGGPSARRKIDHCLTQLEENGFSDSVDWSTEVSDSLTLEELIGALVHSEVEFEIE